MSWKEKITSTILSVMRYVYKDSEGNYCKEIATEEWSGLEQGQDIGRGTKHFIIDLISDERQKAFFAGFKEGAKRTFDDLVTILPKQAALGITFEESENINGAWDAWSSFDKDDS